MPLLEERKRMLKCLAFVMYPILLVPVIRFSSFKGSSLLKLIDYMEDEMEKRPLHFEFSGQTVLVVIIYTLIYVSVFFLIITSLKNTMPGEEHDSAKWANAKKVGRMLRTKKSRKYKKYKKRKKIEKKNAMTSREMLNNKEDKPESKKTEMARFQNDIIFTRNVRVSMDSNCDNINTLVLGGAGRMKTRGFIIPNIIQMNCNPVTTDPKGEILKKTGRLLKENGYDVRVLDLVEHVKSHGYNPFRYFRSDDDILLFVNNMWAAMDDKTATKGEQIWSDLAKSMMMSFCLYLYHFAPKNEQNMSTIMKIFGYIDDSETKKNDDPVDKLFKRIKNAKESSYGYYEMWSSAKGRTLSSVRATFASRMSVFNLESMQSMTFKDEMDILDLATKKVAVFMIIPDNNSVYNFMAGTLYTQMFQQLYDYADHVANGPLPRPVRFFMDEFSNIALPDDYQKILSTSRSRNISFVIVLQDKQQIEAIFEKYYRTLYGNCAWQLFLGSLELETCKYYSELMGKCTIHAYTYTKNYGRQGGSSRQEQLIQRDLRTPGEVRGLSKKKCFLITPYYGVIQDYKYDLKKHEFYAGVSDGKDDKPYEWGASPLSVGTVEVVDNHYAGKLAILPKAEGHLLDVDEYEK